MSNYNSWKSEERYFNICPMCGDKFPIRKMIIIKKSNLYNCRNLTKLCCNCYIKLLDFLGINDVQLDKEGVNIYE